MDPQLPSRSSHRLVSHSYRGPWTYFITVCTRKRQPVLATIEAGQATLSAIGSMVSEEWIRTTSLRPGVTLDAYAVMPDHFHGLVTLPPDESLPDRWARSEYARRGGGVARGYRPASLSALIGGFKAACTRRYWEIEGRRCESLWQRDYHDRIVRDADALNQIRQYIHENPARWKGAPRAPGDSRRGP
jgi:REP element-mobilizing transposase RayT